MSWFDAAGIASLAKNALKEAQKTIDKALDIKEEDDRSPSTFSQASPVEVSDSFFTSWGLKSPTKSNSSVELEDNGNDPGISEKASGSGLTSVMTSSLWGSFTGSFFENSRIPDNEGIGNENIPVSSQPKRTQVSSVPDSSPLSGSDSSLNNHRNVDSEKRIRRLSKNSVKVDGVVDDEEIDAFSDSRVILVVRDEEEDEDELSNIPSSSKETKFCITKLQEEIPCEGICGEEENVCRGNADLYDSSGRSKFETPNEIKENIIENSTLTKLISSLGDGASDEAASPCSLSSQTSSVSSPSSAPCKGAISEGGDKRSSESVEVLGSGEDGCATSPEGDLESAHVGPQQPNQPMGFLRLLSDGSFPFTKARGIGCRNCDNTSNIGVSLPLLEGDGLKFKHSIDEDDCTKNVALNDITLLGVKNTTAEKVLECSSDVIDEPSGHGSPESVEVILEDMEIATSPCSVEVIGRSESSTAPSVSASTSSRPSSSSSSISPTTPGSGSSGFAHHGIHDNVAESSVIHSVVPQCIGAMIKQDHTSEFISVTTGKTLDVAVDDVSPESVEVIAEEEEEMSSSASSTTTTTAVTVLEQQKALAGVDVRSLPGSTERCSKEEEMQLKGKEHNERERCLSRNDELKSSSYLRSLLADAMLEKCSREHSVEVQPKEDSPLREQSPLSSERSDLVKVGEEEMSGQTSGDEELDTTTSSDIEIISSPNGVDSGSNKSESWKRCPGTAAKLPSRQGPMGAAPSPSLSTASSSSSSSSFSMVNRGMPGLGIQRDERNLAKSSASTMDSYRSESGQHLHHYSQRFPNIHQVTDPAIAPYEVEELTKRITEVSDILEARESKLIELSRTNVDLQEQNMDLMRKIKDLESKSSEQEIARMEFEGRLASLDRRLQQANGENEKLKARLKDALEELSQRGSGELATLLREKEEECRELREEGEKLSKQEMNLTTMIKNLRAAQRNSEKTISNLRQHLGECENEVDRVKKSLGAREEVEKAQIEAIHNLKSTIEAREMEMIDLQSAIEEERKSLREEMRLLEENKEHWKEREMTLLAEVEIGRMETEKLRETLTKAQEEFSRREEAQRVERQMLERRLVEVEARGEEVGAQASRATRPLLRQLESLQTMSRQQEAAWEATERELLGKLAEAEGKVKLAMDRERCVRQRCAAFSSRVTSLESQLSAVRKEVETEAAKFNEDLEMRTRNVTRLEEEKIQLKEALEEAKRNNLSLKECLAVERAAVEAEKRRNTLLQDQLREYINQKQSEPSSHHQLPNSHPKGNSCSPRSSPTLSFGHVSLDDSITSSTWLPLFQEDGYHDGRSITGVFEAHTGMAATMTASSSSLIESLQSQLKLKDGEVQQLQWEVGRGESERNALNAEVSSLIAQLSEMNTLVASIKVDNGRLSDLQTKYDALLQMYGEKVEEAEELRLDLQDIKEMYKSQIDELTKKGGKA